MLTDTGDCDLCFDFALPGSTRCERHQEDATIEEGVAIELDLVAMAPGVGGLIKVD